MILRVALLFGLLGCFGCGPNEAIEDGLLGVPLNGSDAPTAEEMMNWHATWTTAMHALEGPQIVADETLRQEVRLTVGGDQLRVRLSNRFGAEPVTVSRAAVGEAAEAGAVVAGSSRAVTFDGAAGVTIAPGETVYSDAVVFAAKPLSILSVSLYFADQTVLMDAHTLGPRTSYLVSGDATADALSSAPSSIPGWISLSGVDVSRATTVPVIAAFGDSITDGYGAEDLDGSWPSRVAAELGGEASVINLGISGNRLLAGANPTLGPGGVARYGQDVLTQSGLTDVIILEGINDLGAAVFPAVYGEGEGYSLPGEGILTAGHRELIVQARARELRVIGATVLPWNTLAMQKPEAETARVALNEWVRYRAAYDAVIDFDALMADPEDPTRLRAEYDSGDGLHPNDAGYAAMAALALEVISAP